MTPPDRPNAPADPRGAAPVANGDLMHAAALLSAMDHGRDPTGDTVAGVHDIASGFALQDQVNRLRLARAERPVGFKIGFTNRTIWKIYGVFAPIWAPVWDTTLVSLPTAESSGPRTVDTGQAAAVMPPFDAGPIARRLNRPRLEPEIVLGLRTIPSRLDLATVAAAIDWVAHGFELVQSPWPDWKFHAGQAIASQSLHGALLVGQRRKVLRPEGLADGLSALAIELQCDDRLVSRGHGTDVLDGPVHALAHWLSAIRDLGFQPAVTPQAGMLVTTGTLTDAQPITGGTRWRTRFVDDGNALGQCLDGPLMGLDVSFGDMPLGGQ